MLMSTFLKSNSSFLAVLRLSGTLTASVQKSQVCGFDDFYKRQLKTPGVATKIQTANFKIGNVQRSLDAIRLLRCNRDVMPRSRNIKAKRKLDIHGTIAGNNVHLFLVAFEATGWPNMLH